MSVYLGEFCDNEDIVHAFRLNANALDGAEVLLAFYSCEDYSGRAFVLIRRDGKLYEVNGSHCSCYGLEDQWDEEETKVDDLKYRLDEGRLGQDYYGNDLFASELRKILEEIA